MLQKLLSIFSLSALALTSCPRNSLAATYWVGITPWQKGQSADDMNRLYLPMLKWLSEKSGDEFKIKIMNSYEGTIDQIAEGHVQIAMLSPIPYIRAKKANPELEILVTELSWNHAKTQKTDSYRSHILSRKDRRDLIDIRSLKGKNFSFVSKESTSGYIFPSAALRKLKLDPKTYFSQVLFLGSHPSVTDAIAAGSVDAGATWDFNWKQAVTKHGDIFKALWTSEPIPNLCIVAHQSIPKSVRNKVRKLLLTIPGNLLEGLSSVGFVAREDSFYDDVRKIGE